MTNNFTKLHSTC